MFYTHRFIENGECSVNQGDGMTGGQDETIGKRFFRTADVPPHNTAEKCRDKRVDL